MQRSSTRSPTKSKVETWPGPRPLVIFIRNLKLLGLDRRPGWPDISPTILAGTQSNLRQRIQVVEWSLYHLFLLWDRTETHNKLQPFFPPLEPLQSVNLRAALFRSLSDLKKSGVLGRDAILRKTMFDDCKGERFEDVLAVFSTAVLRKSLLSHHHHQGHVVHLAIAHQLTQPEQENILPLIISLRSSLTCTIKERISLSGFYENLNQHLLTKAGELSIRSAESSQSISDVSKSNRMHNNIFSMWHGNEGWAKSIIDGGLQLKLDPLLEVDFLQLRSLANSDNLRSMQSQTSSDLLAHLDDRVLQQKSRLKQWREFRKSLTEEKSEINSVESTKQRHIMKFRNHEPLSVASLAHTKFSVLSDYTQLSEYQSLLLDFQESIANISGMKESKRSESIATSQLPLSRDDTNLDSKLHSTKIRNDSHEQPLSSPASTVAPSEDSLDGLMSYRPNEINSQLSKGKADDSVPGTLSSTLLERTRQSMSALTVPDPRPRKSKPSSKTTRYSQQFPVNQFQTPNSKSGSKDEAPDGTTTPQEDLFNEDAEYASVFKSRPKIATSPIHSPAVHAPLFLNEPHNAMSDAEYDERDDSLTFAEQNSPSIRRRTAYM
ncbi:hypothetical protein LOZ36_004172 [Ophidiomyces ophidiicola]|nr:hypothetical protein LOZ36_004172 [Ophidiomyces ophidiicola]